MSITNPKSRGFHLIHNQLRCGFALINLNTIHYTEKGIFPMGIRTIYTSSEFDPVVIYTNPDEIKGLVIQQNKNKSGVYRSVHKDTGKSYIGSSSMLNDRFRRYFNYIYLSSSKRGASLISKALLKYGYAGFRLEILEYCPVSILLAREQFYLDKFNPEYNILKIAGSNLGYKHSEASLKLMSIASKSTNESEEFIKLKRDNMIGRKLTKAHIEGKVKNNQFRQPVIISNIETGDRKEFTSMAL